MTSVMRPRLLGSWIAIMACLALPLSAGASAHSAQPASTSPATFTRGTYGKDASTSGYRDIAATGFNTVMTGPYPEQLGNVAAEGMKGVVWLGNFINRPTCGFEKDDDTVARLLKVIAGSPVIAAYFLGDEPHVTECPQAPALFKQRTALVHSLDPGSQTFTVIQAYENGVAHDYRPWAGAVDIIGFDVYPCVRSSSMCNFSSIDAAIAAIKAAGIRRYWAILQDFQDCYYRLPTPAEIAAQFDRWARSDMAGYFVFSWNYRPANTACAGAVLDGRADNVGVLKAENGRVFSHSAGAGEKAVATSTIPVSAVLAIALILAGLLGVLGLVAVRSRPRRPRSSRGAGRALAHKRDRDK
jgi:hypothetical protein